MFPFSFKVVIVDCGAYSTDSYILESGMGICNSYSQAAKYIEDYYTDDLIQIKELMLYEASELIILPPERIEDYAKSSHVSYIKCDINGNPLDRENK